MAGLAAWTIAGDKPAKLNNSNVGLEKDLEAWIQADPGLVDRGVLQRQLILGAAGRLDLSLGKLAAPTIAKAVDQQSELILPRLQGFKPATPGLREPSNEALAATPEYCSGASTLETSRSALPH